MKENFASLSVSLMSGILPNIKHRVFLSILTTSPWNSYYLHHRHFTDEEMGIWKV